MKPEKTLLSGAQALRQRRQQRAKRARFVELTPQGAYETLVDYSLGRLPRRFAMDALGLEADGDLVCMLGAAGLSRPIVPGALRAKKVEDMLGVLGVVRRRRTSKAKLSKKRSRSKVFKEGPASMNAAQPVEREIAVLVADLADRILSTRPLSVASSGLFLAVPEATLEVLREDLPGELAGRGAIVVHARLSTDADPGDTICAALRGELALHEGVAARLGGLDNVGLGRGVTLTAALSGLSLHTGKIIALVIDDAHHITSTQNGIDAMFALKAARDALNLDRALHGLRFVAMSPYADKLAKLRNGSDQAFFLAPLLVLEGYNEPSSSGRLTVVALDPCTFSGGLGNCDYRKRATPLP